MGCGSSSLKGDSPQGVGTDDPAPKPVKKVATNFSSVNYETADPKQRRNTEYAPHETERQPSASSEAVAHANKGLVPTEEAPKKDGEPLAPYQTIDGDEPMSPSEVHKSAAPNGFQDGGPNDPTSTMAKKEFATENDPAVGVKNQVNGESYNSPSSNDIQAGESGERKKSWLGKKYSQYSDARDGRNSQISDEDMQKYTGKSKDEITEFMETGEGVGGGQKSSMRQTPGPGTGISGVVGYNG